MSSLSRDWLGDRNAPGGLDQRYSSTGRIKFLLAPLGPRTGLPVTLFGDLIPVGGHSHERMVMRSREILLRNFQTRGYLLHAEQAALNKATVLGHA